MGAREHPSKIAMILSRLFIFNALISAICEAATDPVFTEDAAAPERDYSRLPAEEEVSLLPTWRCTRSSCGWNRFSNDTKPSV